MRQKLREYWIKAENLEMEGLEGRKVCDLDFEDAVSSVSPASLGFLDGI